MISGHSYFLKHFSDKPATNTSDSCAFGDALPLSPDQAVFIHNNETFYLEYVRGFGMLGFNDAENMIEDIFNTAIPEQREACGEVSGKAIYLAQSNNLEPLKNGIVMNYAGQSATGELMHLMLEGGVLTTDQDGKIISAVTKISRLPHLPVPKVVRWYVFGELNALAKNYLDESLINPYSISTREAEVLSRLSEGKTMVAIARELNRSPRTVEHHIRNMRNRFKCANIGQLIAYGKDLDLL